MKTMKAELSAYLISIQAEAEEIISNLEDDTDINYLSYKERSLVLKEVSDNIIEIINAYSY